MAIGEIEFRVGQGVQSDSGSWFKCVQVLGTGGNAVVYLVYCTSGPYKGLLFALKVFQRLSMPERRESFLKEIQFLKNCNHPSVMRVFDSGVFAQKAGGKKLKYPFVVVEYLPDTLDEMIRADSVSTVEKLSLALQLVAALTYLASLDPQVVHRDIKPRNIFVKGKAAVLGDFGLMKLLDGSTDHNRIVFKESIGAGMPYAYRTPDLVHYSKQEWPISTKSDVFQLGLVLTELFTGKNPLRPCRTVLEPVRLNPIGPIGGKLGPNISALINKMLTMDPSKRSDAAYLMDSWQGLLEEAIATAHELEGRAF